MKGARCHRSNESAANLLSNQYSSHGLRLLIHGLLQCKSVLIPLFSGDHAGNRNHQGSSVLRKESANMYLYNSLLHLQMFRSLLQNLRILAESIYSKLGIASTSGPQNWAIRDEVCAIQQSNSDDCGIFTMPTAFLHLVEYLILNLLSMMLL